MRVAVVGGGIVGLCCAWYLRQDGHEVTVFDNEPEDSLRCSVGNSGILVPSHFVPMASPGMVAVGLKMLGDRASPFRIKPSLDPALASWCMTFMRHCTTEHVETCAPRLAELHLESKRLFVAICATIGSVEVRNDGMLMVCETENSLNSEHATAKVAAELGLVVESISSEELESARFGTPVRAVGGVYYRDDAHVDPRSLAPALIIALKARGVDFVWETQVQGIDKTGTVRVETETMSFDHVVLACGAWASELGSILCVKLLVQPGKGMSFSSLWSDRRPTVPMLLHDARVAVTPFADSVRFGGTLELGEWRRDPDMVRASGILRSVRSVLPEAPLPVPLKSEDVWTGFRPCSPDGMPLIGTPDGMDRVHFATGHGMMGVSLGPVTGQLVAKSVAGERPERILSPSRFS